MLLCRTSRSWRRAWALRFDSRRVREHHPPWWVSEIGHRFPIRTTEERFDRHDHHRRPPNPVGLDGAAVACAVAKDTTQPFDAVLAENAIGQVGLRRGGGAGHEPDAAAAFAREAPHVEPGSHRGRAHDLPVYLEDLQAGFRHTATPSIRRASGWQCHHIDPEFYEKYFMECSPTQAAHAKAWHGTTDASYWTLKIALQAPSTSAGRVFSPASPLRNASFT